jgi:hypothetical protein
MAARRKDREQGIYRRVSVRMWGDAKVRALTPPPPGGLALWFHLLTGEQTGIIPGLHKIGEAAFAEQLGWPLEGFREAFREVEAQGMARADWAARVIWVPKAIEHNVPASPNAVRAWADAWDLMPECSLKIEAWRVLRAFLEAFSEAFVEAFDEACLEPSVKTSGNQDQEQEQEKRFPPPAGVRARDEGHDLDPEAEQHSAAARHETASGSASSPPPSDSEPGPGASPTCPVTPASSRGDRPEGAAGPAAERLPDGTYPATGRLSPLPRRNELLDARFALTADVIGRCARAATPWYLGHAGSEAQRAAVENAIAFAGPDVAAERLLAFVRAERAAGREPQPGIGWRLDEIQGAEARPRRQLQVQDGDIRVGVAAPAPAEAFQGGERELR